MSAYLQFFVNTHDALIIEIMAYPRSTPMFQAFNSFGLEWEQPIELHPDHFDAAQEWLENEIKYTDKHISDILEKITFLKGSACSDMEALMTEYGSLRDVLDDCNQYSEQLTEDLAQLRMLEQIMVNVQCGGTRSRLYFGFEVDLHAEN